MITAELKNYRQSPRKVRLVADAIRGKKALDAVDVLIFMPKRASGPMKKLLDSAIANANNNFKIDADSLFVKEISVNKGITLHRRMPKARGSATPINKRSSHVKIVLEKISLKNKKANIKTETAIVPEKVESTEKKAKVAKVNNKIKE
jgi:large subunit ribosomal protein L22